MVDTEEKMSLRLLVTLYLVLPGSLILSGLAAAQVDTTPAAAEYSVSVVGSGVVYGEPDIATLQLGVTASEEDVRVAVSSLDEGIALLMRALEEQGIAERKIKTVSFNVWREERYPRGQDQAPSHLFRAQHMLAVELEGAATAGEVLAAAVEAGANAVGGINFGFSDRAELEAQAREAAVSDARRRAEQLAAAAGVAVGEPILIEEISSSQPPSPFFERAAATMSASPVAPGELRVEVQVAIRYRIE